MILILSSFVASSPVGGGAQVLALAGLEVESVLAPTVLFGRHPGLGPPGGGAVDAEIFAGVLAGIEANGVFQRLDAVITGYFTDPAQIEAAARAIDAVKAVRPGALIVVDPIMGDTGKGLYVKEPVAEAIATHLVPRADLITPNIWELERLSGMPTGDATSALAAARSMERAVLTSSISLAGGIGVLWVHGREAWLASHARAPSAPNGNGDLLTCLFTAALVGGASGPDALETAVSDVAAHVMPGAVNITLESLT